VVACWRMAGVDMGPLMRSAGVGAGQITVSEISGVHLLRFADGKLQDLRSYADLTPMLGQRPPTG